LAHGLHAGGTEYFPQFKSAAIDLLSVFSAYRVTRLAGGHRMTSKIGLLAMIVLWTGACTPLDPNVYRSSNQQKTIEHGASVTVTNVASETEAQPFAAQYCSARGKAAKLNRMERLSYHHVASTSALFDCI
jgi:hypothetical protein